MKKSARIGSGGKRREQAHAQQAGDKAERKYGQADDDDCAQNNQTMPFGQFHAAADAVQRAELLHHARRNDDNPGAGQNESRHNQKNQAHADADTCQQSDQKQGARRPMA